MKYVLSTLLFIITITYIIPVKDIIVDSNSICVVDMDEEKDTDTKKQKVKELFVFNNEVINAELKYKSTHHFTTSKTLLLLHKVETPPPNTI